MKIDINKKYKTEDGRKVVIHTVDGEGDRPVVGQMLLDQEGDWVACSWRINGTSQFGCNNLVEVKPEPKFKVGDFVTYGGHSCFLKITSYNSEINSYKCTDGLYTAYYQESNLTKA